MKPKGCFLSSALEAEFMITNHQEALVPDHHAPPGNSPPILSDVPPLLILLGMTY